MDREIRSLQSNQDVGGAYKHEGAMNLQQILAIIYGGRFIIIASLFFAIFVALIYMTIATPVYVADALVQVEDERNALSGFSELSNVLPNESGVGAEIEIIRSRSVLGSVVDDLGLSLIVEPKTLPFVGSFIRRKFQMDEGGAKQDRKVLESFSIGGELIEFDSLAVVGSDGKIELTIKKISDSEFEVIEDSDILCKGTVGSEITCPLMREDAFIRLLVGNIVGSSNVEFKVTHLPRLVAIRRLRESLSVIEIGRDTGIIRMRLEGSDKLGIERILAALSNIYVKKNIDRKSAEAQQSLSFLNDQLPEVRADLERAENRLAVYREQNKTIDLSIETESVLEKMVSIDQRLSELDLKRAELTRNYTSDHPLVRTLAEQRSQLVREKKEIESNTAQLPDVQQELLRLMREVEVSTQLYTFMLNKVQELRVVEAGTVGNVRIIDHAVVYPTPVRPRKFLVLATSLVFALFGSLVYLVLRSLLSEGIVDPDIVEQSTGMPVYSVLPEDVSGKKKLARLPVADQPDSIVAEAFRSLRTSVHFSLPSREGGRVLSISGPAPNVGKTFVSTNLACALAQAGNRVLYIDGDMRRGDSDRALSLNRSPGLSELLVGRASTVIQSHGKISGLDVITRGKSPPNPTELILNGVMEKALESWRAQYDFVLIDTPPVLAVTDPVVLAEMTDALFLVGRAGMTALRELKESKSRFERSGVVPTGMIINGMTKKLTGSTRYGYGYQYYNYKYSSDEA